MCHVTKLIIRDPESQGETEPSDKLIPGGDEEWKNKTTSIPKSHLLCRNCNCPRAAGYGSLDFPGIFLLSVLLDFLSGFRPLLSADFYGCFLGGGGLGCKQCFLFHGESGSH